MRLVVIAVSKRQPDWVDAAFRDYARRMPREARIELVEVKPERRTGAGEDAALRLRAREAERIRSAIPRGARVVALDERGVRTTTRGLSERLDGWLGSGSDVTLLIGGADGLDTDLVHTADETLSLSALTLPHGLARVVLVEQLYRAWSLLKGHPYHRD